MGADFLRKEDYEEPACLLCRDSGYHIPIGRVIDRLDSLLAQNDTEGALRHMNYWLEDARGGGDPAGMLTVEEELMGLYRKLGRKEEALCAAENALTLLEHPALQNENTAATVRLNAATVFTAFGRGEEALPLFAQARETYEKSYMPEDSHLGGLYNNTALCLSALGRYADARMLFDKALAIMETNPGTEPEQAVTELNLANLDEAELGPEAAEAVINGRLERAEALLLHAEENGNTAFTMEKCAPTFDYYGWFLTAGELKKRSAAIYESEKTNERT